MWKINLQAAGAGARRPSMKQRRRVVAVIAPLGAMLTMRRGSAELSEDVTSPYIYTKGTVMFF